LKPLLKRLKKRQIRLNGLRKFIREETVLSVLIGLFILLNVFIPGHISEYRGYIDWKTITTLLALIIVATGIKQSGYLDLLAHFVLKGITDERMLAGFMTALSVVLSMFLTNDITLFIVVPLTVAMQKNLKNDIVKVVIFEAIGVNAGSTLTPIGNPQNIYIWTGWGISFASFVVKMFLPFAVMSFVLAVFIFIFVKKYKLRFFDDAAPGKADKKLGIMSFLLMALFLVLLQFKAGAYILPVIFLLYFFLYRGVLKDVDWFLIFTFIFMFIDFNLIAKAPAVIKFASSLDMSSPLNVYAASAMLSQVMSNVPAAIFMSKFTNNRQAIACGVNIAGNGFIIGSLANIIAIRLLKAGSKNVLMEFHKYSIPYFIITGLIMYLFILLN